MDAEDFARFQVKGTNPKGLGKRAMTLAMTEGHEAEEAYKRLLIKEGYRGVATEVGGDSGGDYHARMAKAVIGAALNSGLIEKEARSIHALMHAAEEAKRGAIVNTSASANIATKVAIVRNRGWVAVALFGESSLHTFSCHERAGLGVMHLP